MLKMAKSLRLSYVLTRQCLEGFQKQSTHDTKTHTIKGCSTVCVRKYCSVKDEQVEPIEELKPAAKYGAPPVPEGGSYLSGRRRYKNQHTDMFSVEKVESILDEIQKQRSINDDMPVPDLPNPYIPPPKRCVLCKYDIDLDYKNVQLLSQFVSPYTGRIYGRHITGLCIPMQKHVSKLIKRARQFGFMPYLYKKPEYHDDPKLYNPFRGIQSN